MHDAMWLTISKHRVFVESAGEGVPVLCVHTAGQSGVQYRDVLEELPAFGFRVVVLDLPGHGRSLPAPSGPITDLHEYAEICWGVIEQLSLERPLLVGCSIGAKIVLDMCAHHGDDVAGAVAMEADAYNGALSVSGLRRSMSDAASPSQGERTYYGTLASVGTHVSPERAQTIAQMHRREDSVITSSDLIGWTSHDLRDALGAVTCPILVVAGSDDFWINDRDSRGVAESVKDGQFVLLEGVGHYPMEEMDDFSGVLAGWLGSLRREQ